MTCEATLAGGPLVCVLPTGHKYGHEFHASAGCDNDSGKVHADQEVCS